MAETRAEDGGSRREPMRARLAAASVMLAARWTPYLEPELLGLADLVAPGSVCIDVGAAAGLYTVALSRLAGPTGQVHSVEPLSFSHPVWTRLLGAREARNVSHHAVALAAEPGSAAMSVPVGRYGLVTGRSFVTHRSNGLGSNSEFAGQVTVTVSMDTLDSLCASARLNRLDFVKIDVEGAELHVLQGGQQAIESLRPDMLVEIEARHTARYGYQPDDVTGWLAERGYTMYSWRRGWREASGVSAQTRNYLFRPADRPRPAAGLTAAGGAAAAGPLPAG